MNIADLNVDHINRGIRRAEIVRKPLAKKKKQGRPTDKSIKQVESILSYDWLTVSEIVKLSGYCRPFVFSILKALKGDAKIDRIKDIGTSGRFETFIKLVKV